MWEIPTLKDRSINFWLDQFRNSFIWCLMVNCQNSDVFYRSAVPDPVAYPANTAELLLFGCFHKYLSIKWDAWKKRLGLNVWSGSHAQGKPQGAIKRMKRTSVFFFVCVSAFSSSSADYDIILKNDYYGFFFSSGIWLVVMGLRAHLHMHDRFLYLFSYTYFVYTVSTPENTVVLIKQASLLLLLLIHKVYLSKTSVRKSSCNYFEWYFKMALKNDLKG